MKIFQQRKFLRRSRSTENKRAEKRKKKKFFNFFLLDLI